MQLTKSFVCEKACSTQVFWLDFSYVREFCTITAEILKILIFLRNPSDDFVKCFNMIQTFHSKGIPGPGFHPIKEEAIQSLKSRKISIDKYISKKNRGKV